MDGSGQVLDSVVHGRKWAVPVLALICALALLGPAAGTAAAGDLKRGSKGPRVGQLQRMLGLTPDRLFGPATRRAVIRFQRRHGLTPDGIAGPATMRALRR